MDHETAHTIESRTCGARARRSLHALVSVVLACLVLASGRLAFADQHKWNVNGNGAWGTAGNWSPAAVPIDGDTVLLDHTAGAAPKTITVS
ncbi:MAG: hypothetical protein RDV41_12015, partial [Planctomycetota bacterium]|nr:hypothetical protein [Planctomycetota bacterium]